MKNDWNYSKYYESKTDAEKAILEELSAILFEVQYAGMGNRTALRREAAEEILESIQTAYKARALERELKL